MRTAKPVKLQIPWTPKAKFPVTPTNKLKAPFPVSDLETDPAVSTGQKTICCPANTHTHTRLYLWGPSFSSPYPEPEPDDQTKCLHFSKTSPFVLTKMDVQQQTHL